MIRLADEDNPYKIPDASIGKPIQMFSGDIMYAFNEGASAQLKKVVEWGNGHCEHDTDNIPTRLRHNCSDCWQALLEEK